LPFEDDMARFYAACDLVVSRAGALTVAEIEETATPAIVVPLPAGKGYQAQNAADLVAQGGALLITQDASDEIVDAVFTLMTHDDERDEMASRAGARGHRRAAHEVARRAMEVANA
jgi:UDP-N-acetylglucosamine:LPS N-acetylglucosamine transferase